MDFQGGNYTFFKLQFQSLLVDEVPHSGIKKFEFKFYISSMHRKSV